MPTVQRAMLRAPDDSDFALLLRLRNDGALQRQLMALPRANTVERVREWMARLLGDPHSVFFVVAEKETGKAAGFVQLTRMDFVHRHGRLGIAIDPQLHGRGLGHSALVELEAYARRTFNLRKIVLDVLADNRAAIALYERCGYRTVGTLKGHFYHSGEWHDVQVMERFIAGGENRA